MRTLTDTFEHLQTHSNTHRHIRTLTDTFEHSQTHSNTHRHIRTLTTHKSVMPEQSEHTYKVNTRTK